MERIWKFLPVAILWAIVITGCKQGTDPGPTDPFADMTRIYSGALDNGAIKIDFYTEEEPFVGYNRVYLHVYDSISGQIPDGWQFELMPLMTMQTDMGTMTHACPVEQPVFDEATNSYKGAIVFIMPTMSSGSWQLNLSYAGDSGQGTISFAPVVVEKDLPALVSFVAENDSTSKYFLALVEPHQPQVGSNPFEIALYTKESMMSFPPVTGYQFTMSPEMPSMGHGSPDNVNPVDSGQGHYKGQVNFTMTGLWRVHLQIQNTAGQMVKSDAWFDIEF